MEVSRVWNLWITKGPREKEQSEQKISNSDSQLNSNHKLPFPTLNSVSLSQIHGDFSMATVWVQSPNQLRFKASLCSGLKGSRSQGFKGSINIFSEENPLPIATWSSSILCGSSWIDLTLTLVATPKINPSWKKNKNRMKRMKNEFKRRLSNDFNPLNNLSQFQWMNFDGWIHDLNMKNC